jgi:replicative DNA helicase
MNNIEKLKHENLLRFIEEQTSRKAHSVGSGTYRLKKCPICNGGDHFNIDTTKNLWNTFDNCGKGSIIDFYMQWWRVDTKEAIKELTKYFNYSNDNCAFTEKEAKSTEKESSKTYKSVDLTSLFNQYYTSDKNDLTYFIERHINDLDDRYLFIGGINPRELFKDHLDLLPNLNNISSYETVIPIWENGKVVNCILRRNDKKSNDNCKTLNLKGCEVKLFNADYLKQSNGVIFVTEGIFDCLSIECLGYKSICLNSANMANKFIDLVKSSSCKSKFILCGDNDKAGTELNNKLSEDLTKLNIENEILFFNDDYKDINEYYIVNKDQLKKEINKLINHNYMDDFLDDIELNLRTPIIHTGFTYIDKLFNGGLYPGLYTIGAISSLGKTALTLQIADQIAESGQPVLFFSLEMPRNELIARSISRTMFQLNYNGCKDIGTNKVLYGNAKEYNKVEFENAFEYYNDKIFPNLKIIECAFDTKHKDITKTVESYVKKTGVKPVVFIDYLQIINIDKEDVTEKRGIDNIVKALKQLSRDLRLIVFVVSSFNRDSYNSPVSFFSFKESGGIEYTSDFVLGLQLSVLDDMKSEQKDKIKLNEMIKESKTGNNEGMREVSLVLLKNRNGVSGSFQPLKFYGKNNLFLEIKPNEKDRVKTKLEMEEEELEKKKQEAWNDIKKKEDLKKKVKEDLKKKKHVDDILSEIDEKEIIEKELAELRKNEAIKKAKEKAKMMFDKEQQIKKQYEAIK